MRGLALLFFGIIMFGAISRLAMMGDAESPQVTTAVASEDRDPAFVEDRRRAFQVVRDSVPSEAAALITREEYLAALQLTGPWRDADDEELNAAFENAQRLRGVRDRAARERELAAEARRIPASDLEANRKAYAELVQLAPENEGYQERLAYYMSQLRVRQQVIGPPLWYHLLC